MNGLETISAISARAMSEVETMTAGAMSSPVTAAPANLQSFTSLMTNGVADMQAKINHANEMVQAYALDDSIPAHSVMIALEEARISIELGLQVRNRLVEAYRDIMNMQL
ncbi:MAG: hypothetical protein RL145_1419 [Pseudomonadota bacterium]|jgi:flagellar hook-basal body complex protein FliE